MALRWARTMLRYWNFLQSDVGHARFEAMARSRAGLLGRTGSRERYCPWWATPFKERDKSEAKLTLSWGGIFMCLEFIKIGNSKKGAAMSMNYYKSWEALAQNCVYWVYIYSWILGESRQAGTSKTERPKSKWNILESPCSYIFHG